MKYTLITGASSGIGLELARIAANSGKNLVLVARDEKQLTEVKSELGSNVDVHILVKDLSKSGAAQKVFEFCQSKNLDIEVLINDAGFGDYGVFAESDLQKQEAMISLNISTLTSLTRLFLPQMLEAQSGKIMNLGSVASFLPGPLMSVYYATKHYVLAFSEGLAEELRGSGITVTCLCPAPTKSGFSKAAAANKSRLFSSKSLPTAKDVAVFGWTAMQNGKRVAIYGLKNRVLLHLTPLVPRSILAQLVKKYQQ